MGYQGLTVVDVDAHYVEDPRAFAAYLDEPERTRIAGWSGKYLLPLLAGPQYDVMLHGHIERTVSETNSDGSRGVHKSAGLINPDDIPLAMDRLGVDYIVLIPTYMLALGHVKNREHAVAIARGYVNYMLERCVAPEKGIYTTIVAPTQEPLVAADLIREFGTHPGVCSVTIPCNIQPPAGSPDYNPIYAAAEELGLPIIIHADFDGPDRSRFQPFPRWTEAHALDFVFGVAIAVTSLVMEGVPERYPNLKFVMEEAGVMWAPGFLGRLDTEHRRRREDSPLLTRLPSEYLGKNIFIGTQPIETPRRAAQLRATFDMLNARDSLMYASDWPHYDYDEPSAVADLPFLDPVERENIMGKTALRVFRFQEKVSGALELSESAVSA